MGSQMEDKKKGGSAMEVEFGGLVLVALNEQLIHVTFLCLGLAMMLVIDRDGVGIVVLTVCCCLCFSWLPAIPPSGVVLVTSIQFQSGSALTLCGVTFRCSSAPLWSKCAVHRWRSCYVVDKKSPPQSSIPC